MLGFQNCYRIRYQQKMRCPDVTVVTVEEQFYPADTEEIAFKQWLKNKEETESERGPTRFTLTFISITKCL